MRQNMNVVFIMTDQQRADSIGEDRHPCANYPNMEQLRRESVSFNRFYTAGLPCVPSRHAFLTGRQPWKVGVSGNRKFSTEGETTWMQLLRENGYRSVSVGKTHMIHAGSFHIQVPVGKSFGNQEGWDHFHPTASPESEENYYDIHIARRACETLDRLSDSEPFALFVGFHAPHEPYVMPEKYLDFCKPDDVPLPVNCHIDEYKTKSKAYRRRVDHFNNMFGDITDEMVRKGIASHYSMLKMVDDCVGILMDKLIEKNLLEHTLIVFASDHGELHGEHGIFNKGATQYESEIRLPFMIRFPDGRHAGKSVEALASSIDYAPTLFDIMGLSPDVSFPGHSLVPSIEDGSTVREYVTIADGDGAMGIRTNKHKLWYNSNFSDGEMYDLEKDPMEMDNLYPLPEYQALRSELFELMLHARLMDDHRDNQWTERERRLHDEIKSSYEPEIV
ncbi:sulfatase-like hydrolase/transferase [Pseudalkalibacillus sp. R45]|uniref:sulfatase-like hydrolase/transferase n=1 Tax=Pseudalkalibacillus sp. R45 TaxID=3457433 RepID=UPI003FCCF40A